MCSVSEKRCACQSGAESGVAVQDTGQSSSSAVGHSPIITLFHNYYTVSFVNYTLPHRQAQFFIFFTANMFYLKISHSPDRAEEGFEKMFSEPQQKTFTSTLLQGYKDQSVSILMYTPCFFVNMSYSHSNVPFMVATETF
jgi:hypothetical protein